MKNFKRIAAILGVILLLAAFCLPMFFAMGSGENSQAMFRGALGVAILLPILLYVFLMVYKMIAKKRPQQERNIENIVFDVGKVLTTFEWEKFMDGFGFSKEKREKISQATFKSQIWDERDKGLLTEQEYVEQMIALAPEYETDIREVMRRTPETLIMTPYAQTWLKYLKSRGYHIYILSNLSHYMLDACRPRFPFLEEAEGEIFSCNIGSIKPDAEIYQTLLTKFQLKPEKCMFIDDREVNCKAAREQGMQAILFENFKQAAAELEKNGIQ